MFSPVGIAGMRRIAIFILALTALSGYVHAHSPSGVVLSYDESSGDLVVAITHQVDDPATHHVKQVTVRQGSSVLIDKFYTSQPDKSSFTYRYNLPQLKGSSGEINVNVACSIGGSRSGTFIPGGTPASGIPGGAAPASSQAPVWAFAVFLAVGLVATRFKR